MPIKDFLIILVGVSVLMFVCRVTPVVLLKGRDLPDGVKRALGYIPAAAFAALVANDLFDPADFAAGVDPMTWAGPLVAAVVVAVVGFKTKSMAWCIVSGVVSLAIVMYVPGLIM